MAILKNRIRAYRFPLILGAITAMLMAGIAVSAQPAGPAPPRATVNQLMQVVFFINANVVFSAQDSDPAAVKRDLQASRAVNALASPWGGWTAVENAAMALADAATLLELPRSCSDGKPAPVTEREWQNYVNQLRSAGMAAYKAAQAKSEDKILEIGEQLSEACVSCHRAYRHEMPTATRCAKK